MPHKVYIQTNGCQMNEYDSSSMAAILREQKKIERVDTPEEADIFLLNTCSIREKAQEKVFSELGVFRQFKEKNPDIIIGVGGCVASQEGDAILKRAPFVDMVFGPQTLHRLPEMMDEVLRKRQPVVDISFPEIEKFDRLPEPKAEGPVAFVSIMEGCSKYCSFCVVPYTRGTEISRPLDDVLAEVVSLVEQGVREVHLLGQNVNDYQGAMYHSGTADLALLIELVAEIEGVERIRFTTSHPLAFSDRLIQVFAEVPKLVNHLHLPVQSGSDRILSMMKRGYTAEEYLRKIEKLKKVRPGIAMSSDFIVGFPSETDEDFEATMALVREVAFDHSFSFIYSKRPGTPAAMFHDNIPAEVKKARLEELQKTLYRNTQAYSAAMVGTIEPVLVHARAKRDLGELAGRTENNRVINFAGPDHLIGQMIPVKVVSHRVTTLRGEMVQNEENKYAY